MHRRLYASYQTEQTWREFRHRFEVEPEDEQALVYEALKDVEKRLRIATKDPDTDPAFLAVLHSQGSELRNRLEILSAEVRARSIQAAEEEHARMIAKIILK